MSAARRGGARIWVWGRRRRGTFPAGIQRALQPGRWLPGHRSRGPNGVRRVARSGLELVVAGDRRLVCGRAHPGAGPLGTSGRLEAVRGPLLRRPLVRGAYPHGAGNHAAALGALSVALLRAATPARPRSRDDGLLPERATPGR